MLDFSQKNCIVVDVISTERSERRNPAQRNRIKNSAARYTRLYVSATLDMTKNEKENL